MNIYKYLRISGFITIAITLLALVPLNVSAEKAPRIRISNLEGKRFISKKYKGGIIVSFFFVDCIPCKKEIPRLYKLVNEEELDIKLLFVDSWEEDTTEKIQAFAGRKRIPLKYFYHDSMGLMGKRFFGNRIKFPTIVGIKNGEILFTLHKLDGSTEKVIVRAFEE
jgi:thiol-disulfide isomerase/thioredoxin